jgi:hypothetical protein
MGLPLHAAIFCVFLLDIHMIAGAKKTMLLVNHCPAL